VAGFKKHWRQLTVTTPDGELEYMGVPRAAAVHRSDQAGRHTDRAGRLQLHLAREHWLDHIDGPGWDDSFDACSLQCLATIVAARVAEGVDA